MLANADTGRLITVKEAAKLLKLHPETVRRMISDGRIPAAQLGGPGTSIRIDVAHLEKWLYGEDTVTRLEQGILSAHERGDADELERLRAEYRRVAVVERPVALLKVEERAHG